VHESYEVLRELKREKNNTLPLQLQVSHRCIYSYNMQVCAPLILLNPNLRLMSMNSFHWILMAIDLDESKVVIYDSMRKAQQDYQDMIDIIQRYFRSIA